MKSLHSYINERFTTNKDTIDIDNYTVDKDRIDKPDTWVVGDIIEASFQYNCRIVRFYRITRRTNSTIWCVRLNNKIVSGNGYGQNGECVPKLDSDSENGKEYSGRISRGHVKIDGCYAYLWNGKPSSFYSD